MNSVKQEQQATREGYLFENYRYFHLRDTAGQERSFHFHEFDKLVLLRSGRVQYVVENITYTLLPGSVLLVPHHSIHKAEIDQSLEYDRVIIYLDRQFIKRSMMTAGRLDCFENADRRGRCLLIPTEKRREELDRNIADFEAALTDDSLDANAIRDTIMLQLLIRINRVSSENDAEQETARSGDNKIQLMEKLPEGEKLRKVLSYINENLAGDLSVDTLADTVFLSRYHFMRLFRAQTGTTVHAYVRQKRLLNAARLIRAGMPAGQAAAESGFSDYSTFNRAFRQSFGISPAELKGQRRV